MNAPLRHPVVADPDDIEGPLPIGAERYRRMADTGIFTGLPKLELRDGVIVRMNAQAVPHMRVKTRLAFLLESAVRTLGLPLEVGIEGSMRLSDSEVPEPDLCLWDGTATEGFIPGTSVRLVVEVADTTLATDLTHKAHLYAAHAIPEYWVADVRAKVIHRHSAPSGAGYAKRDVVRFGETIASATIPGLAIDLPDM